MTTLPVHRGVRIRSAIRGGSSWPLVVETEAGRFVTKLRGAAQGILPLIAEIVVAELATALGLPVPARAVVILDEDVPSDDRNDELADLIGRSHGENLGFRFLDGAADASAALLDSVSPELAAEVLWLDGLVMNPDRTPRNPNVLFWHGAPWLIDHGAALAFQYDFAAVTEDSPRQPAFDATEHLFAKRVGMLSDVDRTCAHAVSRAVLRAAAGAIPEDFLATAFAGEDSARVREAYVAFLWKRLKAPRPFVTAA